MAAGAVLLIAVVAGGSWWWVRSEPAANSAADAPAEATTTGPQDIVLKPAPARRNATSAVSATVRPSAVSRAATAAGQSPIVSVAEVEVAPPVADADSPASASVALPARDANGPALVTVDATPARVAAVEDIPVNDTVVYSNSNSDVEPPRLLSLGFVGPLVNGVDVRRSAIELLISKTGTVERVKLLAPSQTMKDAMLLSRAKSFEFSPAFKDGYPVRYRVVLAVEATP